ncbi:WD40/YVTN/BNR-like repeat-containing protein [Phycicoccus duodecadis]|uniref:Glycosyl hydrolase n=1 Tax=Phycicoccus duodecadis TaxID=173053 RepID=A0A2N3YGB2_9MICO|nr:glycosyl hydrolase [Phycicoccus duodecadis]PKW25885.1 hypothetical protein ATL31_0687 [Phycicoccus duodecadis]
MRDNTSHRRRRIIAGVVGTGLVASAGLAFAGRGELNEQWLKFQWRDRHYNAAVMEKALMIAGGNPAEVQNESREAVTIAEQFAQARTAPSGIVDSSAYSNAYSQISGLPSVGGTWNEVTKTPYNADDPRYRDWYSNSSGGAGLVTGRITGLAADPAGKYVYAAGADGGVFRSTNADVAAKGAGSTALKQSADPGWVPIADQLPSLSGGDLELAKDGSLWFSTGEANTGGTSYVGAGVYRLASPRTRAFATTDKVGGNELNSTTIGRIRPGGDGKVWAATNRGIWYHSGSTTSGAWTFAFAPNMDWMPAIPEAGISAGANCKKNIDCGPTNAAYKNIVNDIAVDPRNPKHVVAAIGWRSGDTYNGFYETDDYTTGPSGWHKVTPVKGQIPNNNDIGYTTFAFSKKGDRLYAIVQQPSKIAGSSSLMGIFVSKQGKPQGPWQKIADAAELRNSGSALSGGYDVGVQAWYNQFLTVDPNNADHVWAGLEEVFETKNGGASWNTPSPYWNFYFPCWDISDASNSCPLAGHPDQHSVAVGGKNVFFGNDGGVYRRPVNGSDDANKNATDLVSLNDGTNDSLQYYSVSVGKDLTTGGGVVVSGGLQDNGVSNLFHVNQDGSNDDPAGMMGSNFGGDGADGFADPRNGCNQVQGYVYLSMKVTNNCAANKGALSEAEASSRLLDPNDPNPRFIAPVDRDQVKPDNAIFGGQYVYTVDNVWQAQDASAVKKVFDNGAGHSSTAVAMADGAGYAAWCGPCNNADFTRGISTNVQTDGTIGAWRQLDVSKLPNRYIAGMWVDPTSGSHALAAINGFSRRFTEGPGVGLGHLYETKNAGETWTDVSGNLPDVPANSVKVLSDGATVVGSDLGAFYRPSGSKDWSRLGTGLPLTVVMDLEAGPDGNLYAATHGRGIWSIAVPATS